MSIVLESTLTCPHCGVARAEIMPTDACQYFYECTGCGTLLKPRPGHCCVFCSWGSVPCPPIQQSREGACCSTADSATPTNDVPWQFCSLDRDAFGERLAEIDTLVVRFGGRARRTDEGMEFVFGVQDGLRSALDALIEKERQCCTTLALTVEVRAGTLALRIAAPGRERAVIHGFVTRFAGALDGC